MKLEDRVMVDNSVEITTLLLVRLQLFSCSLDVVDRDLDLSAEFLPPTTT